MRVGLADLVDEVARGLIDARVASAVRTGEGIVVVDDHAVDDALLPVTRVDDAALRDDRDPEPVLRLVGAPVRGDLHLEEVVPLAEVRVLSRRRLHARNALLTAPRITARGIGTGRIGPAGRVVGRVGRVGRKGPAVPTALRRWGGRLGRAGRVGPAGTIGRR